MSNDATITPPYSKNNDQEQDAILLQPFTYLLQSSGKNIRRRLMRAFNDWLQIPENKMEQVGDIVHMLHNASLLLDDIEDNSVLRRGNPVAHNIFGQPSTINSANYIMMIALERTLALEHNDAVKVYTEQMLELHRGQGMEIYWRDNFQCPSEDDYKKMTIRKTGGLFNLAVRLMQLFSDKKDENYLELSSLLGLYFQIRDDYMNLKSTDYFESKSFAEDLTEGKFSFPIVHAIRKYPDDNRIMSIIRKRTEDIEVKKYCIKLLDEFGSFDYTVEIMKDLDQRTRNEVQRLGGNDFLIKLLDDLRKWD